MARVIRLGCLTAVVILALAALLPVLPFDVWWVRLLEFPRIQIAAGLVLCIAILAITSPDPGWKTAIVLAIGLVATAHDTSKLAPFLPVASSEARTAAECPDNSRLRILIANLQAANENAPSLFKLVRSSDPDLFLAMETDQWWDRVLDGLAPTFRSHVKQVAGAKSHFGIHLFSNLPLSSAEIRFLVGDGIPSVFATAQLANGAKVDFHGLHPRPPQPLQTVTDRDAQLFLSALAARTGDETTIVAGDLNAVPWEPAFRRMRRIGELLDPRLGRGFFNTYNAEVPGIAWPLDHILWQEEFALVSVSKMPPIGSDHYPYFVEICHAPDTAVVQSAPAIGPGDLEEARRTIAAALDGRP